MTRTIRTAGGLAAAALLALTAVGAADAGIHVKRVDLTRYPAVRVSVVTSTVVSAPTLRENGALPETLTAARLHSKSVALVIDRSTSMRGKPLANATSAARKFVAAKPNDDRIALVSFGRTALQLTSFGTATIDVDSGLRTLAVAGRSGTALYDAVVLASRSLASQPRPRLLILLTDGRDVSSQATLSRAIAAARAADVAVYSIGIRGPQLTPGPLRALARATGGSTYAAASSDRLEQAYARIADELRRTWELQYFTAARPGDRLRLAVSGPGVGRTSAGVTIPASEGSPAAGSSSGGRNWFALILVTIAAGTLLFLAAKLAFGKPRQAWLSERLAPWVEAEVVAPAEPEERGRLARLAPVFSATEGALGDVRAWRGLDRVIQRADVPLRAVEVFYLSIGAALVLSLLAAAGGASSVLIVLLFLIGAFAPYVALSIKATKRLHAFENQLPAALNTLAGSLKAGHSFRQAMQTLVDEGGPPIDTEFRRVLTEARLGRSIELALGEMGRRVGSRELDFALRAVVIQQQVGGSLAGLFELVAETLTQRQHFRQKVRALTAQGRLTALILIGLPFAIGLLISLSSPGYLDPLFSTGKGQVLVVVGLTMIAIGSLILRRITSFRGYR